MLSGLTLSRQWCVGEITTATEYSIHRIILRQQDFARPRDPQVEFELTVNFEADCGDLVKRGPTGIIGTNRADSVATVKSLLSDLPKLNREKKPGAAGLDAQLVDRGVRVFRYRDWQKVDRAEVERGEPKGKPREKFTRVDEILAALD